ncbi:MAG: hypothetical protein ACREOZ_02775, partial [Gloeomargaritales cyanobacterium]
METAPTRELTRTGFDCELRCMAMFELYTELTITKRNITNERSYECPNETTHELRWLSLTCELRCLCFARELRWL